MPTSRESSSASRRSTVGTALVVLLAAFGGVSCGAAVRDGDPVTDIDGAVHRLVDVDGQTWHLVEAGEGPAVLLLHGMPESWFAWHRILPDLAANHRVVAVDLKGFGLSHKQDGDYAPAGVAAEIVALMDALEIETARVVGHDWGGLIGARLASDHPDRVAAYAHVCAPVDRFDLARVPDYQTFHGEPEAAWRFLRAADMFLTRVYERGIYGGMGALDPPTLQHHVSEFSRGGVDRAVARYFRDLELEAGGRLGPRSRAAWDELEMPVLIVGADRDYIVAMEHYRGLEGRVPDLRGIVTIDDSGHFPAEEQPEELLRELEDFFREIE